MRRSLCLASVLVLFWPTGAAPAVAPSGSQNALDAALAIEARLLDEDAAAYLDARNRESASRKAEDEALGRLDSAMAADSGGTVSDLVRLHDELSAFHAEAGRWAAESSRLRGSLIERKRRIAEIRRLREAPRTTADVATDPVSGRWTVRILPSGLISEFTLQLDVSLVTGSYRSANGAVGSLRGTFVGEVVTLERVDSASGADVIFEGRLDRNRGEIRGTWRSTLLSSGEPAAGNWVAFRRTPTSSGGEN